MRTMLLMLAAAPAACLNQPAPGIQVAPLLVSSVHCAMPGPPALSYTINIYDDRSAEGTCTVDGMTSTYGYGPQPIGGRPQTNCEVRRGTQSFHFWESGPTSPPRVSFNDADAPTAWRVYRFGPIDPAWGCPGGPFCAQEACGVTDGHCTIGGQCERVR